MTIGIMQGRLSHKEGKPLQSFPDETWQNEFMRASELGFDLIEWLVDGINDQHNPILTIEGRKKIESVKSQYNLNVDSLCAHTFINGDLLRKGRLQDLAVDKLKRIIDCAEEIDIKYLILPLMDAMSIKSEVAQSHFIDVLNPLLKNSNLTVLLECDLTSSDLVKLINEFNSPKVNVLYDIGNAHALGFDIYSDIINLGQLIKEVHMKDRNKDNGPSFRLGEGGTLFDYARKALADICWQGPVVLETPIFNSWQTEAKYNMNFTKNWWQGSHN